MSRFDVDRHLPEVLAEAVADLHPQPDTERMRLTLLARREYRSPGRVAVVLGAVAAAVAGVSFLAVNMTGNATTAVGTAVTGTTPMATLPGAFPTDAVPTTSTTVAPSALPTAATVAMSTIVTTAPDQEGVSPAPDAGGRDAPTAGPADGADGADDTTAPPPTTPETAPPATEAPAPTDPEPTTSTAPPATSKPGISIGGGKGSPVPVRVQTPRDGDEVEHTVLVAGTAEPGWSVTVNGVPVEVAGDGRWSVLVSLPDGAQTIRVAGHKGDQTTFQSVTVTVT